jgi:DMSO reductase anchor subunit
MKPVLSVIVFTVLSGAGLGALAILAVVDLIAAGSPVSGLHAQAMQRASIFALVLVVAGLCSSTFHLGNPRNAWRSLARVRSSWLSREALASIALLAVATGWIALQFVATGTPLRVAAAIAVLLLAWLTLYCTAMIYASLKPIRQWHTPRVPLAYFVLGHASGALVVVAVARSADDASLALAVVAGLLLVAAAAVKLDYYAWIARDAGRLTIEQAIGVPQGVHPQVAGGTRMKARLLDVGHSSGTFLTREFGYLLDADARTRARLVFWIVGVVLPLLWLASGMRAAPIGAIALIACAIGFGAERWLFFAEAQHTVRLYHGDRST